MPNGTGLAYPLMIPLDNGIATTVPVVSMKMTVPLNLRDIGLPTGFFNAAWKGVGFLL
jgi:hypothetical protein